MLEDRRERRLLTRKLLVEIGCIGSVPNGGEIRGGYAFIVDVVKVDVFEEEVAFNIFGVCLAGAESSDGIARE